MADVRITGTQRCDGCGKFIADADLPRSLLHFEPLSDRGPEVVEWLCFRCIEEEQARLGQEFDND